MSVEWDTDRIKRTWDERIRRQSHENLLADTRVAFTKVIYALRERNMELLAFSAGQAMGFTKRIVSATDVNTSMVVEYICEQLPRDAFTDGEIHFLTEMPNRLRNGLKDLIEAAQPLRPPT